MLATPAYAARVHAADATGGAAYSDPPPQADPAPQNGTAPTGTGTGGQAVGTTTDPASTQTVPGPLAKILPNGLAAAPADAPPSVQQAIWSANKIIGRPYRYGGGHAAFASSGYDCSGTVSYALHGAGLLKSPLDSSEFMSWGDHGKGQWITIYTNPGHAYAVIAGLRLDTSSAGDHSGPGPRWRHTLRTNRGFRSRHPLGL
jgi:cell wall-associated NlpC family hydrolase